MSVPTERAVQLRAAAEEKIRVVRGDKDLTEHAKGRRITEIRTQVNSEISKLRGSHAKETNSRYESLHRRMFGLSYPASATESDKQAIRLSYRDALFRADALDKKGALRMLGRAQMIGDALLAKAVAAVAYEQGWGDVIESYVSTSEDLSQQFQELQGFVNNQGNTQAQFRERMAFSEIPESQEEYKARAAPLQEHPVARGGVLGAQRG